MTNQSKQDFSHYFAEAVNQFKQSDLFAVIVSATKLVELLFENQDLSTLHLVAVKLKLTYCN
jgi:hypothetical protein